MTNCHITFCTFNRLNKALKMIHNMQIRIVQCYNLVQKITKTILRRIILYYSFYVLNLNIFSHVSKLFSSIYQQEFRFPRFLTESFDFRKTASNFGNFSRKCLFVTNIFKFRQGFRLVVNFFKNKTFLFNNK